MDSRKHAAAIVLIAVLTGPADLPAQENAAIEWGGLLFGDAYYAPSSHLEAADGDSGLVLRRGYLTLDIAPADRWFGRARLEINQAGNFVDDDFDTGLKDLYLGYRAGRHKLIAGLAPTPTFDLVEKAWGLRHLARTPMDLQGVASRDAGFYAAGPLNASGTLAYRAMWAAAVDFGKDGNPNDRAMAALTWKPDARWTLDVYADHEPREGPRDRRTWQVFAARESEGLRWGLLYANQDREDDPPLELASVYAVASLGEKDSAFVRVDRLFEPSPRGDDIDYLPFDPSAPATALFAGWERRFGAHLRLAPNAVLIRYDRDADGMRPETDIHLRMTLFLDFE